MRSSAYSNSDFMNVYSTYGYSSPSPKAASPYQRTFGSTFNSPKSESPKNFQFSTRLRNDNSRYVQKSERPSDSPVERRDAKTRDYSASRVQTFSSTHSGFYSPEKNSEEKRTSVDPYKTGFSYGQSTNSRPTSSNPLSRSVYVKDAATREDYNILSRKKYEIDISSSSIAKPSEGRALSTKAKERVEDSSPKKSAVMYYQLDEFISKYRNTNTAQNSSRYNTEKSDAANRSLTLSRIMANAPTRATPTSALRNSTYTDSPKDSNSKVNNYFDRQNTSSSNSNTDTSARIQKLLATTPQFEYKRTEHKDPMRHSTLNDKLTTLNDKLSTLNDKPLLTRSDYNVRRGITNTDSDDDLRTTATTSYKSSYDNRDREDAYTSQANQNAEKTSLSSYITKVERGSNPLGFQKFESKSTTNNRESRNGDSIPSEYDDSYTASRINTPNKDSPFKLTQSVLNKEPKFFKASEKSAQDSQYGSSVEVSRWNTKLTRPSSSAARHDESTDSSQDNDSPLRSNFTYYATNLEKFLKRPDHSDYFSQIYREHFQQSFQAMKFCRYMNQPDAKTLAKKKVYLPRKEIYRNKKTLIFDLDETLIHCNDSPMKRSDVKLPIKFPNGDTIEAGINVRPYARECLKELSQYFEIIVFTASHKSYATVVLDHLDPQRQYIQHSLYRDSCVYTNEGVYVKDLRVFANRNLQDVILVDNAAYSFGFQIENGIPIIPFYENKTDQELKHLANFLKPLSNVRDIREVIKKTFKFDKYSRYATQDEVLQNVVFQN